MARKNQHIKFCESCAPCLRTLEGVLAGNVQVTIVSSDNLVKSEWISKDVALANFGDCRVLLCHGHTLGVKSSLLRASYEARERGAQALLYGHTHIPHIDYHDGLWLVNPGSIGDHRRPSYGVLTVEGDKLSPANFTLE